MVNQRASSTGKVILLNDGNLKASLCKSRSGRNTANAGSYNTIALVLWSTELH